MKSKQVEHTLLEKKILQCIRLDFLVNLDYHFKVLELFLSVPLRQTQARRLCTVMVTLSRNPGSLSTESAFESESSGFESES